MEFCSKCSSIPGTELIFRCHCCHYNQCYNCFTGSYVYPRDKEISDLLAFGICNECKIPEQVQDSVDEEAYDSFAEEHIDVCFRCGTDVELYNDDLVCIQKCTTCLSSCKMCKESVVKPPSNCRKCRKSVYGCGIFECERCGILCDDCSAIMYENNCSDCYSDDDIIFW